MTSGIPAIDVKTLVSPAKRLADKQTFQSISAKIELAVKIPAIVCAIVFIALTKLALHHNLTFLGIFMCLNLLKIF